MYFGWDHFAFMASYLIENKTLESLVLDDIAYTYEQTVNSNETEQYTLFKKTLSCLKVKTFHCKIFMSEVYTSNRGVDLILLEWFDALQLNTTIQDLRFHFTELWTEAAHTLHKWLGAPQCQLQKIDLVVHPTIRNTYPEALPGVTEGLESLFRTSTTLRSFTLRNGTYQKKLRRPISLT